MQRLHIEISGTGDPLLLIHGMGSASTAWKTIRPLLNSDFTVITVDLPGHGQTPFLPGRPMDPHSLALNVFDEMSAQGIERFHLAGNSLGGWVSLEMASTYPDRILSLTGIAPAGLWLNPYNARYPGTAIARFLARYTYKLAPTALHFEKARALGFFDVSPRWRDFSYELCLDATLAMAGASGYYPAWDGMLMKRFDGTIPESIPVTIIFGDTDRTLPATTCQERSVAPTHAKWIIHPNTGHAPMWDNPIDVVDAIKKTAGK
ncbi:MAG: alpha/beta hydrolase [Actinobacteria bacterium]|jgi:pimeloyl-ACP methyl ester carboxylesterase|nr:alpha/beta hydrolase [Actinomycetota bacterium]NCW34582.1 alpha/beta hydrolase [Actinomycetota bacterium]NCZ73012.1 alpha/beta hydrolase [Actinomycetota bacterium]NDA41509.1 alpha/beta hydrolase [Actinomycetota bacterium]NDB31124.1 alpha/beta hydrolase [Actinomycetota bacterium]